MTLNHFSSALPVWKARDFFLPVCSYLDGNCFSTGLSCSYFLTQALTPWNPIAFMVSLYVSLISTCSFFKLLFIFHYYSFELENWSYFTFLAETQVEEISAAPGTLQTTPEKKKNLDQVRHKADSDSISSRSALHSPECDSLKMNLSLRCSLGTSELEHLNHSWSGGELLITRRSHEIHVCHQARHRLRWVCCLLFWTFY